MELVIELLGELWKKWAKLAPKTILNYLKLKIPNLKYSKILNLLSTDMIPQAENSKPDQMSQKVGAIKNSIKLTPSYVYKVYNET